MADEVKIEMMETSVAVLDISENSGLGSVGVALKHLADVYGTRGILYVWTTDDKKVVVVLAPR